MITPGSFFPPPPLRSRLTSLFAFNRRVVHSCESTSYQFYAFADLLPLQIVVQDPN